MTRRKIICSLMAALFVGATAVGRAAADDDRVGHQFVSFGPRAAYFIPKQSGANNTWFGGAQLRLYLLPALAIEGSVDYRETDVGNSTTIRTFPVQASLLAYIVDRKPLAIYLLGGGGWYFSRIDVPSPGSDQTSNKFGPHAGGGLEFFPGDHWSVDADYRYIWVQKVHNNNSSAFTTPSTNQSDYDQSGSMITAALNYHF